MSVSRRSALAAAIAAPVLMRTRPGQAADPGGAAVEEAVDALTKALLAGDGPALEALTHDGLSYGHSSGLVQDRAAFIEPLATKRASFPSITLSDRSVSVVGDDAIARHVFTGESICERQDLARAYRRDAGLAPGRRPLAAAGPQAFKI